MSGMSFPSSPVSSGGPGCRWCAATTRRRPTSWRPSSARSPRCSGTAATRRSFRRAITARTRCPSLALDRLLLDQVRGHAAQRCQRRQISAKLGLHQAMGIVISLRNLFELLRQRFFLFAVDGHRLVCNASAVARSSRLAASCSAARSSSASLASSGEAFAMGAEAGRGSSAGCARGSESESRSRHPCGSGRAPEACSRGWSTARHRRLWALRRARR